MYVTRYQKTLLDYVSAEHPNLIWACNLGEFKNNKPHAYFFYKSENRKQKHHVK